MQRIHRLWLILGAVPAVLSGQTEAAGNLNPLSATQQGVHLYGVSVYAGYYSSGSPMGFEAPTQTSFLGPAEVTGVAATFGGSKSGEQSAFTWNYSPSYFNTINNGSNNGSVNHRAGMNWHRKIGSKWTLSASANGFIANLEQLYFNPGVLSSVATLPTTFDDLAAAMLTGKFTDAQLAGLLTGTSLQASPEQGFFYGSRMLNAAANVGIVWAPSGRTSFSVTLSGTRSQYLSGSGAESGTAPSSGGFHLPQITAAIAGISWSYSLSPRTQISLDAGSSRTFSQLQQGYASHGSFSISRTMSRRWFAQGQGGAGVLTYSQQVYVAPKAVQYLFGGSLGYKTSSHTFLVSYNRTLGDAYGLGSGTSGGATGAWNWRPPGSGWSVSASGGYQQLNNLTFQNTRSWQATAGLARSMGQHMFLSAQYVYIQLPTNLTTVGLENSENGVILSLTWSPSRY